MVTRWPLRAAILEAEDRLAKSGVPAPRADAELLAAHVVDEPRSRLPLVPLVDEAALARYRQAVSRRARREPLQHIIGSAPMGRIDVPVGPGVFVPRVETELLVEWAVGALAAGGRMRGDGRDRPVVLDLCTGSGALALAIAHERPDATIHAVESDPAALGWALRNAQARAELGDEPIRIIRGDVTDPALLTGLEGSVDVIVANPPYVPVGTPVDEEVRGHDPSVAVFAGDDGLDVIRPLVGNIARWLRIGGVAAVEHDASNGAAAAGLFRARRVFGDVQEHDDLVGRPRFVTVRRIATAVEARRRPSPRGGRHERTDGKWK